MPTYDYKCTQCNYTFELFQPMSAEPVKICPKCKGELKRLIGSGAGPIFKGSGFYQTDYKNKSENKNTKSSSETKIDKKESPKPTSKPKDDSSN